MEIGPEKEVFWLISPNGSLTLVSFSLLGIENNTVDRSLNTLGMSLIIAESRQSFTLLRRLATNHSFGWLAWLGLLGFVALVGWEDSTAGPNFNQRNPQHWPQMQSLSACPLSQHTSTYSWSYNMRQTYLLVTRYP